MRENVGIVKMKVVDDVRVAERFDEEQFAVSRPIGARDDNGLCGCAFANGRSQFGLYALPAIAVVEFRLVQNLKEHKIRTPRRVVLCQCAPEVRKLLNKLVVAGQLFFEVRLRMDIDNHRQTLVQNHLYGGIQISQVIFRNAVCLLPAEHRLGVYAQPHVIKLHRVNQRDVLRRGPRFEVLFRVALRVVDLREPFAQVDAMPQMRRAPLCEAGALRSLRQAGAGREKKHRRKCSGKNASTPGSPTGCCFRHGFVTLRSPSLRSGGEKPIPRKRGRQVRIEKAK